MRGDNQPQNRRGSEVYGTFKVYDMFQTAGLAFTPGKSHHHPQLLVGDILYVDALNRRKLYRGTQVNQ